MIIRIHYRQRLDEGGFTAPSWCDVEASSDELCSDGVVMTYAKVMEARPEDEKQIQNLDR